MLNIYGLTKEGHHFQEAGLHSPSCPENVSQLTSSLFSHEVLYFHLSHSLLVPMGSLNKTKLYGLCVCVRANVCVSMHVYVCMCK